MRQQFLIIEHDFDDEHTMHVATEKDVSYRIDMADCYGCGYDVYALVDGKLEKVTYGHQQPINTDEEMPFRYASTAMYAGDAFVGVVTHTDH